MQRVKEKLEKLCAEKKKREQEEYEKIEKKKRDEEEKTKEENLRKAKEENERKELEEREKIRQESELEIKSQVVELKNISKDKWELRDLVYNPSPLPSMKTQFSKGVLPSLNSSHFFIKSFVLFPSQIFCSPSHLLVSYSSPSCAKTHFDFKTLFKYHLSQCVRHSSCEMGLLLTFSTFICPFSHSAHSNILNGLNNFNAILLMTTADMCLILVEPTIWLL